jgi:DNA replication protein DnaC
LATPKRALEWPLFCEISGIGDLHYGVKFENIQQSAGKVDYLLKFAAKPYGIIFMQGEPGTGKTFASMAVCELFTRKNTSCIFTTQKQMLNNWLDTFKSDRVSNYIERVSNCNLLVLDDFGVGDVSPGFMSFFMDLINTRMQWSDRGTIITTNLDAKTFAVFCGEALSDRINTGQQFVFKGKTRRTQTVL